MLVAPIPVDEPRRLQALHATAILDTGSEFFFEEALDTLLRLAPAPLGHISFIDETRQWFAASRGLSIRETSRDCAFCAHAILGNEPLLITDASRDERFADNPLVTGAPFIKAYAGAPIVLKEGARIGTVCVADTKARAWTLMDAAHVLEIAGLVGDYVALRRKLLEKNPQRYWDIVMCAGSSPGRAVSR